MKTYIEKQTNELLSIPTFINLDYERNYRPSSLVLLFFLLSSAGWVWEVFLHFVSDGMIINRGMLFGPWLPIYGTGSILILVLFRKWRNHPLHMFGLIMLISGLMQYITSLTMEVLFHARWWDYSDMLLNLNGRICLESLLIFGLCGLIFIYAAAPKLDNLFQNISRRMRITLCSVLGALFLLDLIWSCIFPNMGPGITL